MLFSPLNIAILLIFVFFLSIIIIWWLKKNTLQSNQINIYLEKQNSSLQQLTARLEERERINHEMRETLAKVLKEQQNEQIEIRAKFDQHQLENLKLIIDSLQKGMTEIRNQISEVLKYNAELINERLYKLTEDTNLRLKEINNRVEQRLTEGFEKTTATFADVVKRLALIDAAQKKITELSSNVMNLQEILADKRARGAFGEVQLNTLVQNVMPPDHYQFQYTFSNDKRVDCVLFLPEPTGKVAIDSKFPLESYQKLSDFNSPEAERNLAKKQFSNDIRKHIEDIAKKYIIHDETADFALMFIPAESIFAEIHAYHSDLVTLSYKSRVWMVSPTTMMAILTTARAVLKDAATRQQAHIIKEHLNYLGKEFNQFQKRMDNLAKHVNLAHGDVEDVYKTSQKVVNAFNKIERVDLSLETDKPSAITHLE